MLYPAGLSGTLPYGGYIWLKDGVPMLANSFTNFTQPFTLAPGASRELTVTLEPDAVRTFSATLVVESDDASHPRPGWRQEIQP